jgi:hypothetical protein
MRRIPWFSPVRRDVRDQTVPVEKATPKNRQRESGVKNWAAQRLAQDVQK